MTAMEGTTGSVWALTRSGFTGIFRNVFFWIAIGYSALVVGMSIVWVFAFGFIARSTMADDPGFYEDFVRFALSTGRLQFMIGAQVFAVVVVVALVGTRTVARDRLLGGLEFILSKAIPPWGYVASRTATPVIASLLLLFFPMLLMVLGLFLLIDPMPSDKVNVLWGLVGAAAVMSVVLGALAAGLGSLVSAPLKAVVVWLVVVFLTLPLSEMVRLMGAEWYWLVGPIPLLNATTFTWLGEPFPGDSVWQGWLTILIVTVASVALLRWRVREVVR